MTELVFLGHAVDRSGPPVYLLHLLRWLAANTDASTEVLALEGGALLADYEALTDVRVIGEPWPVRVPRGSRPLTSARDAARRVRLRDVPSGALVHVNTAWSVRGLQYLPEHAGPVVAHVHELEVGLDLHLPAQHRHLLFQRTDRWVAASHAVARNLTDRWNVPAADIHVHHEMIDTGAAADIEERDVARLRSSLGLEPDTPLVGTAAVVNWRKAPDLFVELAARVTRTRPEVDAHFAWVGIEPGSPEVLAMRRDARRAGVADRVHLVPASSEPLSWMAAFDLFVLTAREDAYPLACLEAAAAARPVICFEAGGMPEFVGDDAGAVVDFPDVAGMAEVVADLCGSPERRAALGDVGRRRVIERHDIAVAAPRIWTDLHAWAEAGR